MTDAEMLQPKEREGSRQGEILIIDDDDLFRESLEQNLRDAGYDVTSFGDGETALMALTSGQGCDLILLDWRMPNMNGIEVLRRLRASANNTPVIFLTVLSEQIYEEAALHGGAVDFVEKSRSFAILERRISLILDGIKGQTREDAGGVAAAGESEERYGPLTVDEAGHRILWQGQQISLTINEFKIVVALAREGGKDFSYREIYDVVRGEGFAAGQGHLGYRQNVRTFIKRIRQKFREADEKFEHIENFPGYGYRWRRDDG